MATNKHAIIRYRALDKCFGNFRRQFFIEDLIEVCKNAIYEYTGINNGISRRQIFEDITYMESSEGWNIPLSRLKDGKRVYYRYDTPGFSIGHQPISPAELEQLKDAVFLLSRLKGMPQFEWIYDLLARFEKTSNAINDKSGIVCFQENPDLKGLQYFSDIFNAIVNRQVLLIDYRYFSKVLNQIIFHPYYLKQYNNRWFLFGYASAQNDKYPITSLALDRMEKISITGDEYIENREIDFFEYFYDIVGVSIPPNATKEKIILKVEGDALNYIETKPLHASQKIIERHTGYSLIELTLIINYEFETQLFTYANEVEIISPAYLRNSIKNRAEAICSKNK